MCCNYLPSSGLHRYKCDLWSNIAEHFDLKATAIGSPVSLQPFSQVSGMKVVAFFPMSSSCALKPSQKLGRTSPVPRGLVNKSCRRVPCAHAGFWKCCVSCTKRYPGGLCTRSPKGTALRFGVAVAGEKSSLG